MSSLTLNSAVWVIFARLQQAWFGSSSSLDSKKWISWSNVSLFRIVASSGNMAIGRGSQTEDGVGVVRRVLIRNRFQTMGKFEELYDILQREVVAEVMAGLIF